MKVLKCDFCISNAENGSEELRLFLKEQFPEIQLSRWGCLGNCSDCYKRPFVLLNDEKILEGETVLELKQNLKQLLEES